MTQLISTLNKTVHLRKTAGVLLISIQLKELVKYARIMFIILLAIVFLVSLLSAYSLSTVLFWNLVKVGIITSIVTFLALANNKK
ncbi:hypothetical protein ABN763_04700 [Spongiivirga sp. MCCC 1A20706]|uniref:hypothetical protein n=1 Tax=Spongiivirga sp. MCCC 1A20706 TaxID=3160963 RepID=UPI003977DD43